MKRSDVVKGPIIPKLSLILAVLIGGFVLSAAFQEWHPLQRPPTFFYDPVFFPIEVVPGDVITHQMEYAYSKGGYFSGLVYTYAEIEHRQTITAIEYALDGAITIHATRHLTLWEMVKGK